MAIGNGSFAKCASSFEVPVGTTHCTVRMAAVVKVGPRHFEPTETESPYRLIKKYNLQLPAGQNCNINNFTLNE